MNAEEKSEKALLEGKVSRETSELRAKAVRMIRLAVQSDPLVGVKIFKMKLLSNLITHSLKHVNEQSDMIEKDITLLANALKESEYREQLVHHS